MNTAGTKLWRTCSLLLLGILGMPLGCSEDSLTSPSPTGRETYQNTTTENLDLAGISRVVASTLNGSVSVRGQASTSARLEIRKTVQASTLAEAQQFAELILVEVGMVGGELAIESTQPAPWPGVSAQVDYELVGPAGVDLDLEATNGSISVEGVSGAIQADLANGRIDIALWGDGGGAVSASAVNGVVAVAATDEDAYDVTATTTTGCIVGTLGGTVVNQCQVGVQVVRLGEAGRIPCDLQVVNGTIEINRP